MLRDKQEIESPKGLRGKYMTITKKEIKTEIHVEISREEFCDNYQAMMCDIIEKRWFDVRVNVNTIKEKLNEYIEADAEKRNEMAQESFTSFFGIIHAGVIRYIAQAQGMDVDNYGFVNQKTGLLESTFWQRGSHL